MSENDTAPNGLTRRTLLKTSALSAGLALAGCGPDEQTHEDPHPHPSPDGSGAKPNVLFILVDEMRFPKVFPTGIASEAEFLQRFMPNVYRLWQRGVKLANFHVSSTSCGPARSVLMTGLYTHQTWNAATYAPFLGNTPPPLSKDYPTYGKLMRAAGYTTAYMGKWHLSTTSETGMDGYGFDGVTEMYSLDAANLQGTYGSPASNPPYYNDAFIADRAAEWLRARRTGDQPWCLTVGIQNPHDYQFFPAGTEYQTFAQAFADSTANPAHLVPAINYAGTLPATGVDWSTNVFANPPSYGYPARSPNWETIEDLRANKPSMHLLVRQWCQMQFGGVHQAAADGGLSVAQYPGTAAYPGYVAPAGGRLGMGLAPYSYWQRGMDAYTLAMTKADRDIGTVVDSLPPDVAENTIIVFSSDHGELSGAHGLIANKSANFYDEAIRVPFIFVDPTGRFAGDVHTVRTQLASAVDFAPLMATIAHGGSTSWMTGDNATLYGTRYNMLPLLKSARAQGRPFVAYASDEAIPASQDFVTAPDSVGNKTPFHILGLIVPNGKLALYSNWTPGTDTVLSAGQEGEFYDPATAGGQAETANTYATDPRAGPMRDTLLGQVLNQELRRALPASLQAAQSASKTQLLNYYVSQTHQ